MKKPASILASALALVFGSTQGHAAPIAGNSPVVASETPQKRERLRMPPLAVLRAHSVSERNDAVFRNDRDRLAWCDAAYALLAHPQASQRGKGARRVSNKARRHMLRLIDEVRNPEFFERAA